MLNFSFHINDQKKELFHLYATINTQIITHLKVIGFILRQHNYTSNTSLLFLLGNSMCLDCGLEHSWKGKL